MYKPLFDHIVGSLGADYKVSHDVDYTEPHMVKLSVSIRTKKRVVKIVKKESTVGRSQFSDIIVDMLWKDVLVDLVRFGVECPKENP